MCVMSTWKTVATCGAVCLLSTMRCAMIARMFDIGSTRVGPLNAMGGAAGFGAAAGESGAAPRLGGAGADATGAGAGKIDAGGAAGCGAGGGGAGVAGRF